MKDDDLNRICTINGEIAHREIEGQILILRPDDNFLYTLNGSGRFIWVGIAKKKKLSSGRPKLTICPGFATRKNPLYASSLASANLDFKFSNSSGDKLFSPLLYSHISAVSLPFKSSRTF